MDIRNFEQQTNRVETGVISFGNDWPGIFIRGDNAAGFALALQECLIYQSTKTSIPISIYSEAMIESLLKLLQSCNLCLPSNE